LKEAIGFASFSEIHWNKIQINQSLDHLTEKVTAMET
jgi:hypothetical protein